MNSWYHAQSCAKKWGGTPEQYLPVHEFIDSSKQVIGDVRHRSLYHHTLGVWLCQRIFGVALNIEREGGSVVRVPVRLIAERHIIEDLGWLPSPADYIEDMPIKAWMSGAQRKEMDLSVLGVKTPPVTSVPDTVPLAMPALQALADDPVFHVTPRGMPTEMIPIDTAEGQTFTITHAQKVITT